MRGLKLVEAMALEHLCPNGIFGLDSNGYWLDGKIDESLPAVAPTIEEIEQWVENNRASIALVELRKKRDKLLTESDAMYMPDRPDAEAWSTYRQALRDLPANSSPEISVEGQLSNVTWPTKPS